MKRPDLRQVVVGVVLDGEGRPIRSEAWLGNATDVKALLPVVDRLRQRFGITRMCVVADRGMISDETMVELERRGIDYILGARLLQPRGGQARRRRARPSSTACRPS